MVPANFYARVAILNQRVRSLSNKHSSDFISLVSFALQAIAALVQMLAVSYIFDNANYAIFSLGLASALLWAVIGSEWLRSSVARFLPAAIGKELSRLNDLWNAGYFVYLCATVLATSIITVIMPHYAIICVAVAFVALAQGFSDLMLTILRSRQKWKQFTRRQSLRAVTSTVFTIAVAASTESAQLTLAVYAISLVLPFSDKFKIFFGVGRKLLSGSFSGLGVALKYGIPIALTSISFLGIPAAVRWWIAGLQGLEASAGSLLAVDLYQRPFGVLLGAVVAILSPSLIKMYDLASAAAARAAIIRSQLFVFFIGTLLAVFAVLTVDIVSEFLVPQSLSPSFKAVAKSAIIFYYSQAVLQYCGTLLYVLNKNSNKLIFVSGANILIVLFSFYFFEFFSEKNYINCSMIISGFSVLILSSCLFILGYRANYHNSVNGN